MKKFKLIVISSLLIATGITAFAERATNKKVKKKQLYLLEQQRKNV